MSFGSYTIADGQVQLPESGLNVQMAPAVNGVELQFDLQIQVQLQNPPVPSAQMLSFDATVAADVPVGPLPGEVNVAMLLNDYPADVSVLCGCDPITTKSAKLYNRFYPPGIPKQRQFISAQHNQYKPKRLVYTVG